MVQKLSIIMLNLSVVGPHITKQSCTVYNLNSYCLFSLFFLSTPLSLARNSGVALPGKGTAAARAALPIWAFLILSLYQCMHYFLWVQTKVWLPEFGMHTDADACDCTHGLYRHC